MCMEMVFCNKDCIGYSLQCQSQICMQEVEHIEMQRYGYQCCRSASLALFRWILYDWCTCLLLPFQLRLFHQSAYRLCLPHIAPSTPCHLTVISSDSISMDFPTETGFKGHVSERSNIKRDLFIVCMSCAIHFKHVVRSFRSF